MINIKNAVVVDGDMMGEDKKEPPKGLSLLSWLNARLEPWRDHRRANYDEKWKEYYRIWRGIWSSEDKTRASERSKLISPATQQAVEAIVAELEEATFGRGQWFDIVDDFRDEEKNDIEYLKKKLMDDLEREGVKSAVSEAYLNAALYGTGIAEILVEEKIKRYPMQQPTPDGNMAIGVGEKPYVCVKWRSVSPLNFLIDPTATSVEDSIGVAIESTESIHTIAKRIQEGVYFDVDVGSFSNKDELVYSNEYLSPQGASDKVKVTTYYGLVPREALEKMYQGYSTETEVEDGKTETETETDEYSGDTEIDWDDELVEAIVVIANDSVILKAVETPYMMQDRPVIAFPMDRVPNRFWGRGIVEKGYNPQKALDAELRARMDALALTTHPMMAMDATRLPRGAKFQVQPGATLLSNGDPREVYMPFNFGQLNPVNFQATADLERMIQMATGAIDTAMPVGGNPRNATASGMSMMMGATIKRQKRVLQNVNENFMVPGIRKSAYRYMQFDPENYPVLDVEFQPISTMGIMAREYEQQQFIQLLSMAPQGSPLFMLLMKSIFENSSFQHREEAIAAMMEMMQPDPSQQKAQQQMMMIEMLDKQKNVEYKQAQIDQLMADVDQGYKKLQLDAALATQDKSPTDPLEAQLKVANLALAEKELEHRVAMDKAELSKEQDKMVLDYDRELRSAVVK